MTKYFDSSHRYKPKEDTPIPISDQWTRDPNPSYYCNYCQRRLSKLQGRSGENVAYYCVTCSIEVEVDPSLTELRSASKLSVPDGPIEHPSVAFPPEVSIGRKKKELTGSFKVLQQKGARFTNITESKG
jgi:hypothetical protein